MPRGRKRDTCECGNAREPGEKSCASCRKLDGQRRVLNEEMGRRHAQESRERKALFN